MPYYEFCPSAIALAGAGRAPASAGAALYAASKRRKMLEQLLGQSAKDPRAVHYSPAKRKLRFILLAAVLLLLIAAAARPYRSSRIIPHQTFGRDILVLFDVSKSMWATDVARPGSNTPNTCCGSSWRKPATTGSASWPSRDAPFWPAR